MQDTIKTGNVNRSAQLDFDQLNEFYRLFLFAFAGVTDAPIEFIFTALLPSLGAAISINRWIQWGSKTIYPNIWIMLVGPSTLVRKTTALNLGLYFNHAFDQKHKERNYILPNDGSFAAFLEVLEGEQHGVLKHSEVASLLEIMSKGYNNNMKSLFTDFFDVPLVHKIRLKGADDMFIEKPIFSMGTGTTLPWLKKNITKNDAESGFLARFLYCCKDRKGKSIAIPREADANKVAEIMLIFEKLYSLEERKIDIDESFKTVYSEFYDTIESTLSDHLLDDGTKSLIGRLQTDYFLKFTILECVLTGKHTATAKEANAVIYLIDFYIHQALVIMDKILKTEHAKNETKVLDHLKEKGRVTATDLHRLFKNNIHADNLNAVIKTLVDARLVRRISEGKTTYYELSESNESGANT